jgi:outer membrane protein TolC
MKILILTGLLPLVVLAQPRPITMEKAVQLALQQNKGLQSAAMTTDYYRALVKTSGELPKTELRLQYGQYNSYAWQDNHISLTQVIPFPSTFSAKKQLAGAQVEKSQWEKAGTQNELIYQVRQAYVQLLYLREREKLLVQQDSLFSVFARSADLRYRSGESRMLEKTAAEGRVQEARNGISQNEADMNICMARLQSLLGSNEPLEITETMIPAANRQTGIVPDSVAVMSNPYLQSLKQEITITARQKKVYSTAISPDITVGYFNQSLIGTQVSSGSTKLATGSDRFQGFQLGLALPLWFGPLKAKVNAEEKKQKAANLNYENNRMLMQSRYLQAVQQFNKQQNNIIYYNNTALPNAELILKQSRQAYGSGEIGYAEHFLNMEQALGIRQGYLQTLHDAEQAALYIEYLEGTHL